MTENIDLGAVIKNRPLDHTCPIEISLFDAKEIEKSFREEWLNLSADTSRPNPFFESWFMEPALRVFDPDGEVQLCMARCVKTNSLVGLLPLIAVNWYRKLPIRYFQTWINPHCFNGQPLIRTGYEAEFYLALAQWMHSRPQGSKFLQLRTLPYDLKLQETLETNEGDVEFIVQQSYRRAQLFEQKSFNEYIKTAISAKRRSELRRTLRRLSDIGTVEFKKIAISEAVAQSYHDLEMTGWKSPKNQGMSKGQTDQQRQFLNDVFLRGKEAEAVDCHALLLDGEPIALAIQFKSGTYLSGFKTVYDERYACYSPGVHILMNVIEEMIEGQFFSQFDSCAEEGHPILEKLMQDRMLIAHLNFPAGGGLVNVLLSILQWPIIIGGIAKKRLFKN